MLGRAPPKHEAEARMWGPRKKGWGHILKSDVAGDHPQALNLLLDPQFQSLFCSVSVYPGAGLKLLFRDVNCAFCPRRGLEPLKGRGAPEISPTCGVRSKLRYEQNPCF